MRKSKYKVSGDEDEGKRVSIFFPIFSWNEVEQLRKESGLSRSRVIAELIVHGSEGFRRMHSLGGEAKSKTEEGEKKTVEEDIGQKLSEEYGRQMLQSWKKKRPEEYDDGWTPV